MIGTVGRLDEIKCPDLLLRGFARLPSLPQYADLFGNDVTVVGISADSSARPMPERRT